MRRRNFLALTGGAAAVLAAPSILHGQPPSQALVGVLSPLSASGAARNLTALRTGFRDLNYSEARNLSLAIRHADGVISRLSPLAEELIALKPDAIVVGSVPAILALHRATRTIPIVMSAVTVDPTTLGLVTSLAKPGGNVTGFWLEGEDSLIAKRLELLRDAVPGIATVGLAVNPDDATDKIALQQLPNIARALNMDIRVLEIRSSEQIEPMLSAAARDGAQALCISQGPLFNENRSQVAAIAIRLRLPAVYGFREFAIAGGLMSYASNLPDVYRRAASVVDKILKGAKPADIPIERPGRFDLVFNLKTAKSLGLTVPERVLMIADEVIE